MLSPAAGLASWMADGISGKYGVASHTWEGEGKGGREGGVSFPAAGLTSWMAFPVLYGVK